MKIFLETTIPWNCRHIANAANQHPLQRLASASGLRRSFGMCGFMDYKDVTPTALPVNFRCIVGFLGTMHHSWWVSPAEPSAPSRPRSPQPQGVKTRHTGTLLINNDLRMSKSAQIRHKPGTDPAHGTS